MTTSYHVNGEGNPGLCKAVPGNCPFGADAPHYPTVEDARRGYEASMTSPAILEAHRILTSEQADEKFNDEESTLNYDLNDVSNIFAEKIQGKTFHFNSQSADGVGPLLEKLFGKKELDDDPKADLGIVELKTLTNASSKEKTMSLTNMRMENTGKFWNEHRKQKPFSRTLKKGKWLESDGHYYTLVVDREANKVRMLIADKELNIISRDDYVWDIPRIHQRVDEKLQNVAIAKYTFEKQAEGADVTFTDLHTGGFTKESFIDRIESGEITMELRFTQKRRTATFRSPETTIIHGKD